MENVEVNLPVQDIYGKEGLSEVLEQKEDLSMSEEVLDMLRALGL